jgi:hypothetical protein
MKTDLPNPTTLAPSPEEPEIPRRTASDLDTMPPADNPSTGGGPVAPSSSVAEEVPPPESASARRRFGFGTLVIGFGLTAILGYGLAGLLQEAGIAEVRRLWIEPPATLDLSRLPPTMPATVPAGTATPVRNTQARAESPPAIAGNVDHPGASEPIAEPDPNAPVRPLHDQPPRLPPQDLPRFTVRDGEAYDFLFSVDEETLKRLGDIQGQLDGIAQLVTGLNQTVQAMARHAERHQQRTQAWQMQEQQGQQAVRAEQAALRVLVEELEARIKRGPGFAPLGASGAVASGEARASVPGWSIKAVSGNRAWLRTPQGREVTVTAGDRLKGLGIVQVVDAVQGVVVLRDGRVMR